MSAESGKAHRPELGSKTLHQAEVAARRRIGEVVLGVHKTNPRITLQLNCSDVVVQEDHRRVRARGRTFNEARLSRLVIDKVVYQPATEQPIESNICTRDTPPPAPQQAR